MLSCPLPDGIAAAGAARPIVRAASALAASAANVTFFLIVYLPVHKVQTGRLERLVPGWQEVIQAWQERAGDVVSLQLAGVVRHVHGVLLQRFQWHHLAGGLMGG